MEREKLLSCWVAELPASGAERELLSSRVDKLLGERPMASLISALTTEQLDNLTTLPMSQRARGA